MAKIIIEGSTTPSTYLALGARMTVERTPFINKLIRGGFVTVVGTPPVVKAPAPIVEDLREANGEPAPPLPTRSKRKAAAGSESESETS